MQLLRTALRGLIGSCWLACTLASSCWAGERASPQPSLRWAEGQPGCTFSAGDDGRYRYGLWTDDFGIVLAVDSQELQKSLLRTEPVFAILLTVHYRGPAFLTINPAGATLEFVMHEHDVEPAVDAEVLAARFQRDGAEFAFETERQIEKHPDKATEKRTALEDHRRNVAEMLQFLKTRSLREVTLDGTTQQADGWIFFNARSKWVGDWNKQEKFVLRVPLADRTVEFPFLLPPSQGDLILRRRR